MNDSSQPMTNKNSKPALLANLPDKLVDAMMSPITTLGQLQTVVESINIKQLGSGTSRSVYKLSKKHALKIAIDQFSTEANEQEWTLSLCTGTKYFPKIIMADKFKFRWLVVEMVDTNYSVLEATVKKMFNTNFYDFTEFVSNREWWSLALVAKNQAAKTWLDGLQKVIKNCDLDPMDYHDGNWGVRFGTGELVIVDFQHGFPI